MEPLWKRMLEGAFFGAFGVGFASFIIGFFGPIIFMPEANQGPLIGIFVTGPLGTLFGAVGGALVAWRRGLKERR